MARDYILNGEVNLDPNAQPPGQINLKYRRGREMDELIGICRGVLADGVVTDQEILYLKSWLLRNQEIIPVWPARELAARLVRILADGVVSSEERDDLTLFLQQCTGETAEKAQVLENARSASIAASTELPLDMPPPAIVIPGRSFCFTGKFLSGTRQWCVKEVESRGGALSSEHQCDLLVIGVLGSRDWAHSSHGRKIETVVERRQPGQPWPKIVAEEHWAKFLK